MKWRDLFNPDYRQTRRLGSCGASRKQVPQREAVKKLILIWGSHLRFDLQCLRLQHVFVSQCHCGYSTITLHLQHTFTAVAALNLQFHLQILGLAVLTLVLHSLRRKPAKELFEGVLSIFRPNQFQGQKRNAAGKPINNQTGER